MMPWIQIEKLPQSEPVPGYKGRFIHTDRMTLAYWEIAADSAFPEHSHPNEQVVNLLGGTFELTVAEETKVLHPGEVVVIPPDVVHSGISVTECRMLDVFHPIREDLRSDRDKRIESK